MARLFKRLTVGGFLVFLVVALSACGGPEEKRMKFFEKGKALFDKGNYVEARLEFRNALQVDPKFAEGHYWLGMVELQEKDVKSAYAHFSKAVELDENLLDAQVALGRIFLLARETAKAREKVDLVLANSPEYEAALLLKAAILVGEGAEADAESLLRSLMEKHPETAEPYLLLANLDMKQKDPAAAQLTLEQLLAVDESNKAARIMLARILEGQAKLAEAEAHYRTIADRYPDDDGAKMLLAGFYDRTDRDDEAERLLKALVAAKADQLAPRLYLAEFYRNQKRDDALAEILTRTVDDLPHVYGGYEMLAKYRLAKEELAEAVAVLNRFADANPTSPDRLTAQRFVAQIKIREAKPEEALVILDEILKENPEDGKAHALKGDILMGRKAFGDAVAEYRAGLRGDSQNIPALLELAKAHYFNNEAVLAEDTYKQILKINPRENQARFGLAEIYGRKGDLEGAKLQLEEVLEAAPNDPQALLALGDLHLAKKEYAKAETYLEPLLRLEPISALAYYKNGVAKLAQGQSEEARGLFEKALHENPDFVPAMNQLLGLLVREEKLNEAIARCKAQIDKRPDSADYLVLLAKLHATGKDLDRARQLLEKALEMDPNHGDALFSLAALEREQGSVDEALARYRQLRASRPDDLRVALLMAVLLEQKQDHDQARRMYEAVLDKHPESALAANNLAFHYAEFAPTEENLQRAEKLIQPLLDKFRQNPNVVDTAAWIRYRRGDCDGAKALLLEIGEETKKSPVLSYHMGMTYFKLGDKQNAKTYLEMAAKADGTYPGKSEAEKTLELMRGE